MSEPAGLQGLGKAPGARSQGQDLNSQLTGNKLAHSSHSEGLELVLLVEKWGLQKERCIRDPQPESNGLQSPSPS